MENDKKSIMKYLGVAKENQNLIKCVYYSFFVSGLLSISIGLIVPFLRSEYGFTYEQTGRFLSAHQIGNVIAILLAGFLPYAIGRKQATVGLCSGIVLGFLVMTFFKSPILLLVAFTLVGIGKGTLTNNSNVTISEYSTNKAPALNILHATFAVGALLSPFLMFLSSSLNFSFRLSTFVMAILALLAVVLFLKSKLISVPTEKAGGGTWDFISDFWFWLDSSILFFYICTETSIIGWFVIYFYELNILPEVVCNFTPTLLWSMILIGRLFCATLSSKVNKSVLLLTLGISLTVFFAVLLYSSTAIVAIIALMGIGFSMSGIYPTTVSTMKGTQNTIQTGFSLAFATAGGIIMPTIVGNVADSKGISTGIFMVMIAIFIMLTLMIIKCLLPRKDNV